MTSTLPNQVAAADPAIFGNVSPPPGVAAYDAKALAESGGMVDIGIIMFFSNLIRLITIVGGLFVMINIIYAGWIYLSSNGDKGAHEKVANTITFSVLGLAIIVGSFAIAAIVGLLFFDDATFILSPTICGPEGCPT